MDKKDSSRGCLRPEYLDLTPSTVTFLNTKTQARITEPSYVAVEIEKNSSPTAPFVRPLAAGRAALAYQNTPGVAVFSPFRQGQIADYGMSVHFFKTFLKQLLPKLPLFKSVYCIHEQEFTTEVEERALIDAGIQTGARRVFLYTESLSALLTCLPQNKSLKNAIIIHIEPQDRPIDGKE